METGTIKWLTAALIGVAVISVSYFAGRREGKKEAATIYVERMDTLVIVDTITKEKPVPMLVEVHDSIPYPVTKVVRDTMWLPREVKVYRDETYKAVISGVDPSLDLIEIYQQEKVVTKYLIPEEKKPSRWGLGVHAGYGAFPNNGQISASPYIGIGLSYNLFSW